MNKSKSSKRNGKRGRASARGGGASLSPPPFQPTVRLPHKFRFVNGANSGTYGITRAMLLNLLQEGTTTGATSYRLIDSIRVKKVEVWANPSALGSAPTTVSIEWLGENGPSTIVSDTTMGVRPAHVSAVPPPASSNRWWSHTGSTESDSVFSLVLPIDCVVDVSTEVCLFDSQAAGTAGDIGGTSILGVLAYGPLDGYAGSKLTPVVR